MGKFGPQDRPPCINMYYLSMCNHVSRKHAKTFAFAKNIHVTTLSNVIGVVNFRVSYAIRGGAVTPAEATVRAIQRGSRQNPRAIQRG